MVRSTCVVGSYAVCGGAIAGEGAIAPVMYVSAMRVMAGALASATYVAMSEPTAGAAAAYARREAVVAPAC